MLSEGHKFEITRSNRCSIERETARGKTGMVATAHPIASEIGEQVLKEGGNAIDAAVAIQFALNVVEPMMTGIGGSGFFMVYHNESKTTKIFDGHSEAPKAAHADMFLDDKKEVIPFKKRSTHATAVAIPGILKAMDAALNEYGSKSLAELIEPAALVAEKGISMNWVLMDALNLFEYRLGDEGRRLFFPKGKSFKEGDILIKEHLAKTFRIIQKEGISAFYEGEIAEAIVKALQDQGGFMTLEDLKNYEISVDEPVWGEYRGYKIASSSPPSAGGTSLLYILKLLEDFSLDKYGPRSWEKYYLFTESMRLAFSDKIAYLADPRFNDIPVKGLLHDEYIADRRNLINFKNRNSRIDFGNPWKYEKKKPVEVVRQPDDMEKSETTHFTVVDRWGNIAACTSTVEHPFGSGIMVPGYGLLLNNELTDFDPIPGGVNEPGAGKRPVSCKSPTILFKDEKPVLTLGSPGGPTIIASVFQTIVNIIDFKMDLKEAIEEPRIFATPGSLLSWEAGIDMVSKGELESMGYEFGDTSHVIGNVQAIQIDPDTRELYGAADSSREGTAIGLDD
ncbi:gamma-glutamyltransferase [Neobacillus sp. PS3-34]|uniref:gamma-glutamyltransferase n=1 Tax=Neobacillus sp. PS3-34 TaxID=3070678 RepID=UPI0027DFB79C|nr:gamma-glutamyltransferase [Neobacillus sp. PS3-34]WML49863.1 gamma-glutamyltransferase [Neobacillus sp. PS3-34]